MSEKTLGESIYLDVDDSVDSIPNTIRRKAAVINLIGLGTSIFAGGATISSQRLIEENVGPKLLNPLEYGAMYHTGDFMNGFENAYFAAMAFGILAPKLPYKVKTILAVAISTALLALAEIPSIHPPILGTADIGDIPAGIIGLALFARTSIYSNRTIRRKS